MNITDESVENEETGQHSLNDAKVSGFDTPNSADMSSFFNTPKSDALMKSMVNSTFFNTNMNLSTEFVSSKTLNFDFNETVNVEDNEMESSKIKVLIEKEDVNYYNEENMTVPLGTNDDQTVPNTQIMTEEGFSAAKASQFFDIVSNFQIESVEIDYIEESIMEYQETAVPKPQFNNHGGRTPHNNTNKYSSISSNNYGSLSNDELNNISVKIFTDEKGVLSGLYSTGEQASKKIKYDAASNNTANSTNTNGQPLSINGYIPNADRNEKNEVENNVPSIEDDTASRGK